MEHQKQEVIIQNKSKMQKIITIIGARPQFIKAAALSNEVAKHSDITEVIVHTGQHFDKNMSDIFFEQMQIPKPNYNLNINSVGHGAMTGRMLEEIEKVLLTEKPDWVVVYGDTNSTIAGALAAKKLHIKVAHIEAGLRSFNMQMPEEVNRILTDRISDILFCPTQTAVNNLQKEGYDNIDTKIINCGDVMYDAALHFAKMSQKPDFDLPENFGLVTIHRAENTDNLSRLKSIVKGLNTIAETTPLVFTVHPRTKKIFESQNFEFSRNIQLIPPVGYLQMVYLLQKCNFVMTDSGGLQKEAYFFAKPCITMRDETEWVELVENGFNTIVGSDTQKIVDAFGLLQNQNADYSIKLYGNGDASRIIINAIQKI